MGLSKPVHQILSDAADLIDERGWCQNAMRGLDGEVCAEIAIDLSCEKDDYWDAVGAIEKHVGTARLYFWNDAPERTQDEVVSALREAARLERGRE